MNAGKICLDSLEKYGEYTALDHEGCSYTNVEHHRYAGALASVLKERKVARDDRVVVMMPNSPEVIAAFQAVWRIGCVIVPVTPQLQVREVRFIVENSGAQVIVTNPLLADLLRQASEGIKGFRHLLVIGDAEAGTGETNPASGAESVKEQIASATPIEGLADRRSDDMALLMYTSGTTGTPKGVMLSHENMLTNTDVASRMLSIRTHLPTVHALPLSHSYGVLMMNLGYFYGMFSALLTRWETELVFQTIEKFRVERFCVVPAMLTMMLNFADREKYDLSSVEWVWSGAAPLPNDVRLEFEKVFHCVVRDGYGLSETSAIAAVYYQDDESRAGSCGRAAPGVQLQIVGPEGDPQPARAWGEVCVKGKNVMRGYWKQEEATRAALRDGWMHTGDIGYLDEDGFLYITDRKKDLIIKGGENISPREIEEAMYDHPDVSEAAVVSVPHEKFGEDIWAAVTLKPNRVVSEEDLRAHVSRYVTKFKVPTRIRFVADLPKNPVGKILKREIRSRFAKETAPETD